MILEELNNNISQCLTDTAIEDAKRSLCHGLVDLISTYKSICTSIVFLHRYNLTSDYFEDRMNEIISVSKDSIIEAIDDVIKNNKKECVIKVDDIIFTITHKKDKKFVIYIITPKII